MKRNLFLTITIIALSVLIMPLSSCWNNRIKEHNEWKKIFDEYGVDGCFEVYENNKEIAHFYNKERCATRFLPASTFKIFSSLAALQTETAPNDQYVIKWDGVVRSRPEWNKDLTMTEAFKVSAVPYYQALAKQIGIQAMKNLMDSVKYGNMQTGSTIDSFWLDGSLQISADEQVGFLKRLYFAELKGFSERSQRIVKSMMFQSEKPDYKIYYKTGWGNADANNDVIWIVGFVERINRLKNVETKNIDNIPHPYFFALNFTIKNDDKKDWLTLRFDLLNKLLSTMSLGFK